MILIFVSKIEYRYEGALWTSINTTKRKALRNYAINGKGEQIKTHLIIEFIITYHRHENHDKFE